MPATHQHADAVVGTGNYELRAAGAEALGTAAAERIAEKDGVVASAVGCGDSVLKMRTHLDAKRMQAHGDGFKVDRVRGAGDDVFHFARENLAMDKFEVHKNSSQLSAISYQLFSAESAVAVTAIIASTFFIIVSRASGTERTSHSEPRMW